MRWPHRVAWVSLGLLFAATAANCVIKEEDCPKGMVKGGKKCEYINLCPDGRPMPCKRPVPILRPCERETIFAQGAGAKSTSEFLEARRVLFVSGELNALIGRYSNDAAALGIRIDWKSCEVIYVAQNRRLVSLKVPVPGVMKRLVGVPPYSATLDAAKGIVSHDLPEAEVLAKQRNYDVVCGATR